MGNTHGAPKNKTGAKDTRIKLERASKTGILSLSEHKLKEVPLDAIVKAGLGEKLRTLDLSVNGLAAIPSETLMRLPKVKTLKVGHNKLESLAAASAALSTLEAGDNKLSEGAVDAALAGGGPKLERLVLARNPLGGVPASVWALAALKELDLTDCGISRLVLPDGSVLALLTDLLLDKNRLTVVPETLAAALPKLRHLSLEHNRVLTLPPALFRAPYLDRLELKGNPLSKATFLALDGADDFMQRREKTRKKDAGLADLSVCGLAD